LDFDSGEVGSTNHTQLKLRRAHTCHAQDEFAQLFKRQTFATGIFKTELSLCHFWIRTRNECSVRSDL